MPDTVQDRENQDLWMQLRGMQGYQAPRPPDTGALQPLNYAGVEADPGIGQGTLAMLPADPNQAAFLQNQRAAQQPQATARSLPQAHYDALVQALLADPHRFLQRLGITRAAQ